MKVTQARIREETERREANARGANNSVGKNGGKPAPETHLTKPLEENINRVVVEGQWFYSFFFLSILLT